MVKISRIAAKIQSAAAFMKEYDAKSAETSEKSEQAAEQGHIVLPRAIILIQEVYPIYCSCDKRFGSVRWHIEHQLLWSSKRDGVKHNKKPDADEAMQNSAGSDICDAIQPTDGITIKTETESAIAHALQIKVTDDQIDKQKNDENHIIPIFDHKTKFAADKLIKYADKKEENDKNIDTEIKITTSELKSCDDLEKQGYQKANERSEISEECGTTSQHKKTDTCDAISTQERTDVGHTIENNDATTLLTAKSAKLKGQTVIDQTTDRLAKGLNEDKHERCTTDVRLDGAAMSQPRCNNASGDNTIAHVNNNPSNEEGNFTAFATASVGTQNIPTQKQDTFDIVLKLPNEDFRQVLNTDPACDNQYNQTDFLKINKQWHREETHKVRSLEAYKKKCKRKKRIKTRQSYIDGNVDNLQNLISASNVEDDKQTTYSIESDRTNISSQLLANNLNTSLSLTPTTTDNLQPLETCQTPVIQNVSVSAESHDECTSNTIDYNIQANVIENDETNLINKQAMEYRIGNVHAPNTIADSNAGHDNITCGEITSNNVKNESATKVYESICFLKSIKTDEVSNKLEDISCIEKIDNKTIVKPSISVNDFQHNQKVSDNIADSDIVNLLPPDTEDATKRKHRSKKCCKHHDKTTQNTKQEMLDSKSYSGTVKVTKSTKFSSIDNFKANNIACIPLTSLKRFLTEQNGDKPQELPKYVEHNPTVVAMLLKMNNFQQIKTHLAIQIKRPCIMTLCPSKKIACQCPKHCQQKPKLCTTHEDFKMQSTATNIKEDIVGDKGMHSSCRFEETYIKSKLADNMNLVSIKHVKALNVALKTITIMTGNAEMYPNPDQAVSVASTSLKHMYTHSIMSIANLSLDAANVTFVGSSKRSEDAINTVSKGIKSHDDNVTWTSNSTQKQALRTDNVAFYTTHLYLKYAEYRVPIDSTPEQTIYTANVLINSTHQVARNKVHKCTHRNEIDAFTPHMATTSEQEDDFVNKYVEYTLKKLAHTISPFHIKYKNAEVDENVSVDASIKQIGDGKCVVRNKVTKSGKETQAVEINNTVKGAKNEDNIAKKFILTINDDKSDFSPVFTARKQSEDAADETLLDLRIHYEYTANVSIYITSQVTEHVVHAAFHVINKDYVDKSSDTSVKEMSNLDENDAILAMTHKQVERIENNIEPEHDAENVAKYAGSPTNVIVKRKRKMFHDKLCKYIKSTVCPAKNKMQFANNSTPKLLSDDDDKSEINKTNDETRFSINYTKHVVRAKRLKTYIKSDACEHDMNVCYKSTPNDAENHSNEVTAFNEQTLTALDIANNFKSKLITNLSNIAFQITHECAPGDTKISCSIFAREQIEENVNAVINILLKNAEDNLHALHNATLKLARDMLQVLINTICKPSADNVKNNPKKACAVKLRSCHAFNVATSFISKLIANILYVAFKIRHETASEAAEVSRSTTYKEIENSVNSAGNFLLRNVENNVYAELQSNTQNPAKEILQKLIKTIYIQRTERACIEYLAVGDIDDDAEIDVYPVQYLEKIDCTVFYDDDDDGGGILRVYADSEIHNIITTDQIKAMAADVQNGGTSTGLDSFRC